MLLKSARAVLALACGVLTGTALNLVVWVGPILLARKPGFSPLFVAMVTTMTSLAYGAIIAALCVLPWLGLGRLKAQSPLAAALLGMAATVAFWCVVEGPPRDTGWNGVSSHVLLALVGAIAGVVTLMTGRVLERRWGAPIR